MQPHNISGVLAILQCKCRYAMCLSVRGTPRLLSFKPGVIHQFDMSKDKAAVLDMQRQCFEDCLALIERERTGDLLRAQ